jgi:arylsulfatase A-like enzyme
MKSDFSSGRRTFLKSFGLSLLSIFSTKSFAKPQTEKPNVLFISIDDLNDWIGCMGGHPNTKTPNLDRLAQRGVLFTNAHCSAPVCNPSRVSLMTGIKPSTSGVYVNKQEWRENPVLENRVTLPQHFMENGYTAIGSGKIYHLAYPHPESWDDYWPSKENTKPNDPTPQNRPLNGFPSASNFDWGPVDVPKEQMSDWQVADWVISQLQKEHEKPLFLGCGFYRPHLPWYVPQEYFDRFPLDEIVLPEINPDDLDDVPPAGVKIANSLHNKVIEYDQYKQAVQGYLACISFTDDCVGRVLDALDNGPHKDNTVIVLWSDHGWHLGEKLHWKKFALWEEATHNVLMFVAPGVTKNSDHNDQPVSLLDIYPTLIELCGLTNRPGLEGSSLVPFLKDSTLQWDRPALCTYKYKNHALRFNRWRYIQYEDGTEELYDHDNDPLEWTNLALDSEYLDIKDELKNWLPTENAEKSPPTTVFVDEDDLPESFTLCQNYPNPFNPTTAIQFEIVKPGFVELSVFNSLGQKVRALLNEEKPPGSYLLQFDGKDELGNKLSTGIYFYRLSIDSFVQTKSMMLLQ